MTKVSFRTNILLKSIIGKDLITDDNIAVLELIKNSFDSGSKVAEIIFRDVETNLPLKDYKTFNNSNSQLSVNLFKQNSADRISLNFKLFCCNQFCICCSLISKYRL